MAEHDIGALLVVNDNGELIGILSERDIVIRGVAKQCNLCGTPVDSIMTRKVCIASPDEDYESALAKMQNTGCRHIPLVVDKKPVGLISMRDLVQHQLHNCRFDVRMLEQYITS